MIKTLGKLSARTNRIGFVAMCGRFGATFTFREIMVRWNLQRDLPLYAPRFNIAPSQQVPVIVSTDSAPDAKGMRWGLVPWAKDQAIGNRMINARRKH